MRRNFKFSSSLSELIGVRGFYCNLIKPINRATTRTPGSWFTTCSVTIVCRSGLEDAATLIFLQSNRRIACGSAAPDKRRRSKMHARWAESEKGVSKALIGHLCRRFIAFQINQRMMEGNTVLHWDITIFLCFLPGNLLKALSQYHIVQSPRWG